MDEQQIRKKIEEMAKILNELENIFWQMFAEWNIQRNYPKQDNGNVVWPPQDDGASTVYKIQPLEIHYRPTTNPLFSCMPCADEKKCGKDVKSYCHNWRKK